MPDAKLEAYNASHADMTKLRAYARRVARETQAPLVDPLTYTRTSYVEKSVTKKAPGLAGFLGKTVVEKKREPRDSTIQVIGRHWILDGPRYHRITQTLGNGSHRNTEETNERTYMVLLPDVSLKRATLWTTTYTYNNSTVGGSIRDEARHSVRELSDHDIRCFDFERRHSESRDRGISTAGDREPGRRLLVHAKGVGLSKSLNRVLQNQHN